MDTKQADHIFTLKGRGTDMTDYGRSYTPPVFHTERASTAQIKIMQIVFDTLEDSGIDFAVVQRDETNTDELVIKSYGDFTMDEKGEIMQEVIEMYMQDLSINHISME